MTTANAAVLDVQGEIEPRTAAGPARLRTTKYRGEMGPTGETFEFAASARSSSDRTFRFVWTLAPGKRGPGEHFHADETETFEVVSGRICIWVDGVKGEYGPGDVCVVKRGVRHKFLNAGREPVVINVSLDGHRMEDVLVPISVAVFGRTPALKDFLRMVASMDGGASTPSSAAERAVLSSLARFVRALGVKPFEPVLGWDA